MFVYMCVCVNDGGLRLGAYMSRELHASGRLHEISQLTGTHPKSGGGELDLGVK